MDTKPSTKSSFGCLLVLVLAIFLISFLTTRSLNPLAIYTTDKLWIKVIFTVLAVLTLFPFFQILIAFRGMIVQSIIFLVAWIFYLALIGDASDGRIKAAYLLLDQMKIPTTVNENAWGISDFEIFADARRLWINDPKVNGNEVIIPIWVRGKDKNGFSGNWKMKLQVAVEPDSTNPSAVFKVKDYSIHEIEPLPWWEQVGRWLFSSVTAPLSILSILFVTNSVELLQINWGIILLILGFFILVGYLAHVYFGSVLAVVLGVLFWIIVPISLIGQISSQ